MSVKTIPIRLYVQILIFSALVAVGLLILWHLQRIIQGGIVQVRDNLIIRLEQQIDRKIRYSSISPSILGSFDVRNVRIMGMDDHPLLTISRFRVAYSLLDLLRGMPQAIKSVRIDSPHIDFNAARDKDLLNLLESFSAREGSSLGDLSRMLPNKMTVRIRNGSCLIYRGNEEFDVHALNIDVDIADSTILFDGKWNSGVMAGKQIGTPVNVWMMAKANGSIQSNMETGEAIVDIISVTGDANSTYPISFELFLRDNTVSMHKISSRLPYSFMFTYGFDTENINAQFECTNLKFRDFLSFSGGLEGADLFLDIIGSGTASFERKQDGAIGYLVDLAGTGLGSSFITAPDSESIAQAAFQIYIEGDESNAQIDQFRFSIPQAEGIHTFFFGDISFSGNVALSPFAPNGMLSLANFSISGTESLNADIIVRAHENEVHIASETLNIGQLNLNTVNIALHHSEKTIGFTMSMADDGLIGSISLQGSLDTVAWNMETSIGLNSFMAGALNDIAAPFVQKVSIPSPFLEILGSTKITAAILVNTDFSRLSYYSPRVRFTNGMGRQFNGYATVTGTEKYIELSDAYLRGGEEELLFSGNADFVGIKDIGFSLNANYRNIKYMVTGTIHDDEVIIKGPYGLDVHFSSGFGRTYTGYMKADEFPVPFLGRPALLTLAMQFRYNNRDLWHMTMDRFEAADIITPAGTSQLRIFGWADQDGAHISEVNYRDRLGPLNGSVAVAWNRDYSSFTGTAGMGEGREHYHVAGSFAERHLSLSLAGTSMRLDRFISKANDTLVDGEIDLSWHSLDSFNAVFNLSSINGKLPGRDFSANAYAVLDSSELNVNSLTFRSAGIEAELSGFSVNGARGTAGIGIALNGIAGGKRLEGGMSLEAHFKPVRSWLEFNEILNAVSGTIHVNELIYGNEGERQTFDINFSRADNAFSVSGGPRNLFRFRMDNDGSFYGGLASPFPVRGTIVGTVKQKTISAHCSDLYVDIEDLFKLLPENPGFYMTGGYMNASFDIKGSLSDPEFYGTARATSMKIRVPQYIPHELRPIPFTAMIEGNEMRFGPVPTSVGSGAGSIDGRFQFDRWIPNIFSLDVTVPRETPIPYNLDISGFLAHGDVTGKFNISLENQSFDISGNLQVNNTEMGINSEEISRRQRSAPFSQVRVPFVMNLTVNTGPVVDFFYPSSRFPILRANPDMGTRIRITADSQAQQYSVVSDVRIRSGEIFYFERSFYIRSGLLTFRENELRFAPRLTARAEIRDRTDDGPVTISMIVDNAPLLSFTARFESTPSLSQMEIFTLLGQNITGTQIDESGSSIQRAFLNSGSELLTHFIVGRQLEQQIRNFMRLDMFNIRTQILQNAVYTAFMQQSVDRTSGVGNYFDNTTVFGGKYIGQDMFIQGMLSMRYDANRTTFGGITLAPDFGVELQNPLFSIRWDFIPTHPENWYVNDNSITLTWRRTF